MSSDITLSTNSRRIGYWLGKRLSEEHKRKIGMASKWRTHTTETKRKIKEALTGRKHTEEHRKRNSEAQKGKKLSAETKKKISNSLKGRKIIFSEEHKRKCRELRLIYNKNWKGKKHNEETKKKISESHKGMKKPWVIPPDNKMENNPNWQGGKSFELYGLNWTDALKNLVRRRDDYTCRLCGKPQEGGVTYDVHHIDFNKKNCESINLITLCHNCHVKTNRKREYWIRYFQNRVNWSM